MRQSRTLSVGSRRHRTPKLTCRWKPERGTSSGWRRSGAGPREAQIWPVGPRFDARSPPVFWRVSLRS